MKIQKINFNIYNSNQGRTEPFHFELNTQNQADSFTFNGATGPDGSKMRKNLHGITCPCCGIKMLNNKDLKRALMLPHNTPSKKIIAHLRPYKEQLHEVEKNVFAILEFLSKHHPKKNLRELLDIVRKNHIILLHEEEKEIINRIRNIGNFLHKEDHIKLTEALDEAENLIMNSNINAMFARRAFIGKIGDITSNFEQKDIADTIFEIAHELPRAGTSVNAFIIKYSEKNPATGQERNSHDIINGLMLPSLATIEHVKARSPLVPNGGGKNEMSNYILECARDNNMRECMPFRDFVKNNPQFYGEHLQKYIDAIIERLNRGELKGFERYPLQISRTLRRQSKGQIHLDISKLNPPKEK